MGVAVRLTLVTLFVLAALPLEAAVFQVTKTADTLDGACDDDCSLREAVVAANHLGGTDVILLGSGVYVLSRPGRAENEAATGDLDVSSALVILGGGADRTVIDGGGLDRVLESRPLSPVEIHGVTIRNGRAEEVQPSQDNGAGGGIAGDEATLVGCVVTGNEAETGGGGLLVSTLTVRDSTISDNAAPYGGGIAGVDVLRLENVTLTGNRATEEGGALNLFPYDHLLSHVTITGNSARVGGGLITTFATCPSGFCMVDFQMTGSIVAGNSATTDPDCAGLEGGPGSYNVFGIDSGGCGHRLTDRAGTPANPLDPKLSPLGDHGGPTPTHLLLPGSPAIDLGPSCGGTDQRGALRPADGDGDGQAECDSGAVEVSSACLPGTGELCLQGGRFRVSVTWQTATDHGTGYAVPLTADTGSFWFFAPDNLELTVKVLNGCALSPSYYWVFLAGLTDVQVEVTVVDTKTGVSRKYNHPGKVPFQPQLDTAAFATCP